MIVKTHFKNILGITLISLLLLILAVIVVKPDEANAAKIFHIKTSYANKSHTAIRVKWKTSGKMAALRVKIYKGSDMRDNLIGSYVISNKKRSYIFRGLKKNEYYTIFLFGYSKKNADFKYRIAKKKFLVTSGVSTLASDWIGEDWYLYSKDYVEMDWLVRGTDLSIKPNGIQIFRKENDGDWKKIVTLKESKKFADKYFYKDRDIEFGQTYKYKARAYVKVKKKKKTKTIYGRFSNTEVCEIFNRGPAFETDNEGSVPKEETASKAVLTSTADKLNFDTVFRFGEGNKEVYANDDIWADVYTDIEESRYWTENYMSSCPVFIVKEYRIGDGEWQEAKGDVTVRKNEVISLKFEGKTESDTCNTKKWIEFVIPDCLYNGKEVYGLITLTNGYNGCSINDSGLD